MIRIIPPNGTYPGYTEITTPSGKTYAMCGDPDIALPILSEHVRVMENK